LPGLDIIRIYKDLGGEIITVGSDAHNEKDLGSGIKQAYELAESCGFKYITTFTNRVPSFVKISESLSIGA